MALAFSNTSLMLDSGLSEPHGQQLGALDRDEIGLALVSDGLSQQRLTCNMNQN